MRLSLSRMPRSVSPKGELISFRYPSAQGHDRGQDQVVVVVEPLEPESRDHGRRNVADAVLTARERRPSHRRAPHDVAEGEREQNEVHVAGANGEAEHDGEQRGSDEAAQDREREPLAVADLEDRGGVGADGEERRVAHRQEPDVADQEIRAEREEPEDQDLNEQARPEGVEHARRRERHHRDEDPRARCGSAPPAQGIPLHRRGRSVARARVLSWRVRYAAVDPPEEDGLLLNASAQSGCMLSIAVA